PGKKVVGAKIVRSLRWINFEEGGEPVELLISVERMSDSDVRGSVRHASAPPNASPLSEAVILFGEDYPPVPKPEPFELDNPRRPATIRGNPYDEHRMFHGASFQGVVDMHAIARNGVEGRLKILPVNGLFRNEQRPTF